MKILVKMQVTIKNDLFYIARIDKGYKTFKEMSIVTGLPIHSLISYENNRSIPGPKNALIISECLGVRIEDLWPKEAHKIINKLKYINKKFFIKCDSVNLLPAVKEESTLFMADLRSALHKCLDTLEPREKKVLELRYGLNGNFPMDLREVGKLINLSKERVRQIEKKAIARLRLSPRRQVLKEIF